MRERPRSSLVPLARAGFVLACLGQLAACGGEEKKNNLVDVPADDPDAGLAAGSGAGGRAGSAANTGGSGGSSGSATDGGTAADGGGTGGSSDGGEQTDASTGGDGGPTTDAGADASSPNGDPDEPCSVSEEHADFEHAVSFADEAGFAVTLGSTGFGVAFQVQSNGCNAIATLPVAATGTYGTPQVVVGECPTIIRHVSLLHVDDGFRMTWMDNSAPEGAELQSLVLNEALSLPDNPTPTRVTNNLRYEKRPAQWQLGSAAYLTWISIDPDGTKAQLEQINSATSDAPQVLLAMDSGFNPTSFAAAQVGKDRGAVVFLSEGTSVTSATAGMPGIWLLPLDTSGAASGSPVLLSSAVTTRNAVDIATRDVDGGAVVYSLDVGGGHEVRFQRLDNEGGLYGDAIPLLSSSMRARDAGLARLGDGYVVGFRVLPADGETRGEIRMMFITKEGNVQTDGVGRVITYPVADASADGGRVSVRISTDGQLLVSFLDTADDGTKLRLVRKRLDCTL